jgi:hypothetical protein
MDVTEDALALTLWRHRYFVVINFVIDDLWDVFVTSSSSLGYKKRDECLKGQYCDVMSFSCV